MKTLYYPFFLKNYWMRMPEGRPYQSYIAYLFAILLLFGQPAQAQFGSDLGAPAISTLAWDHISSFDMSGSGAISASIGLTTSKKVYTWGANLGFTIHSQIANPNGPKLQMTPFFVPFPSGETPQKVRVALGGTSRYSYTLPTYFSLTESGKLYAWGINSGLVGSAVPGFPIITSNPALIDTTKAVRKPVRVPIVGTDSVFVDMDFASYIQHGIIIGASGKAYHIGYDGTAGGTTPYYTSFATLPNPAGVAGSFKYTKVWVAEQSSEIIIYLKGNDGNIYYTGAMPRYSTGVPSIYPTNPSVPTTDEQLGRVRSITPRLVPFPAGEDIIHMSSYSMTQYYSSYALSASGKAYMAGTWRFGSAPTSNSYYIYVVAPLKVQPTASDLHAIVSGNDTTFVLKQFNEIALPPGASKIVSITRRQYNGGNAQTRGTLVIGDNNRVYWSGTGLNQQGADYDIGDFLQPANGFPGPIDFCGTVIYAKTNSFYQWNNESINFRGAAKFFQPSWLYAQLGIISATGRGYFVGKMSPNTGTGKLGDIGGGGPYYSQYPVPIANELLLSCNTSPGTGGPLGEPVSTPGVGVIDCSKTKLYPAPVQGTPSELSLLVTINVTTVGDFSPITISGSGMSLVSGFDKVTATTTGVQTFHIPIKYDGTALTNAFQFTIGQAGSCSADLTNKPSNEITRVWILNNCSAITPGVLSK